MEAVAVAVNPNPDRITDASWWFMEQLLGLAPGTVNGGIYAIKPGYHNTRNNLRAHPAWRNDYSIRLPADRRGPGDKAAGYDWTFPDAQAGDYRRIRMYGDRVRRAFQQRDPRLSGWREVMIQADADAPPEGYDFVTWTTRTPEPAHRWHGHFSELRENLESYPTKQAMLSILDGRSLAEWRATMGVAYRIQSTDPKYNGRYYLSNHVNRRGPIRTPGNIVRPARAGTVEVVLTDAMRRSVSASITWEQYLDAVAGPPMVFSGQTRSVFSTVVAAVADEGDDSEDSERSEDSEDSGHSEVAAQETELQPE
jgi:hypothetical protein